MTTEVPDNQVYPDLALVGETITTEITSSSLTIVDDGNGNLTITGSGS